MGDVAFPTALDRERARRLHRDAWDESEHYWAADETAAACRARGIELEFTPVSSCGGVFSFAGPKT